MIFHVRRFASRLRFLLLFSAFTFLMYHLLLLVTSWMEPTQKYREPTGRAVKVFQEEPLTLTDSFSMGERLKLFYRIGE